MRDFRDVKVWTKAHQFVLAIYQATKAFPDDERYGLTAQMRRAATSISTNIAEGCGRNTEVDFARILQIAAGSASEVEYQLLLAHDLRLLDTGTHGSLTEKVTEIKRMLSSFMKMLRSGDRP